MYRISHQFYLYQLDQVGGQGKTTHRAIVVLMGVIGSLARIWSQASPNLSKSMQSVRVWQVG
jgi:hypothetical protein